MAYLDNIKIIKETIWSFASKGIAFLLLFLLNVYLARNLGIDQFGIWTFYFSLITIFIFLSSFGIDFSTKKFLAQYNNELELTNVLRSSVKLRLIFSIVFCVILILIHEPLAIIIGRPEFSYYFLLSVPIILFAGFCEFLKQAFIGLHQIKYNCIMNTLEYGSKLFLVVFIIPVPLLISDIIKSFTIAYSISVFIGLYILCVIFYKKNKKHQIKNFTKDIFRYSMPLFIITIGFLIATEIDTVMLGFLSTDTELGIYGVAKQVVIKLPHISVAIAMGSMPVFAKLNDDNRKELKIFFYKLLKTNTVIYLIITTGILLFSPFFVPMIFGNEYCASVLPLQILTVYSVVFSYSILLGNFLDYQGLANKRAVFLTISVIINIIINAILIPEYGAVGAAIATSISYFPYIILNWIEVKRFLK